MLGNGILETTTGATTGDLTLTGVTGRPRFSDFFTANATEASADIFYYSILTQDTIPVLVEQGIGWLSATGTLKRATILCTYSSGVPTFMGTAFSLTSGSTYNVICTPEAAAFDVGLHEIASLTGSGAIRAILSPHLTQQHGGGAMVKDRLIYVPVRVDTPRKIASIRANNGGTAGTGGTRGWRIGLYSCLKNGMPGRLIEQSGDIASSSFGAISYSLASALRLLPGWYYVGLVHDYGTTAPTVYANANNNNVAVANTPLGANTTSGLGFTIGCYEALSSGWTTMPSTANSTQTTIASGGGVYAPAVALGVG